MSLHGKRITAAGRHGQMNGWNAETRLLTMWDEDAGTQIVVTLDAGQVPEAAPFVCAQCLKETQRVFPDPREEDEETGARGPAVLCVTCSREAAGQVKRNTPCDRCNASHAWRNPYTRRNEYLCGECHAKTDEGVVLNKWFARISEPLNVRTKEICQGKGVGSPCRGEVKPRGKTGAALCNAHAGRTSSEDPYMDRV